MNLASYSVPKLPKMQVIKPPKPIKVQAPPAPKIASINVAKLNGGYKVQHLMTHGPKVQPFVFSDPARMMTHLKRIESNQWRMPQRDPATPINKALDIDGGQGSSSW